jgi:hypothetical protein
MGSVEFLEDSNPALRERNGAEFTRLHRLIETTDEGFGKAAPIDWQSDARDLYGRRLREAKEIVDTVSEAFRKAGIALTTYGQAVDGSRRAYIAANKDIIKAAALDAGLPPEMVAGIAWPAKNIFIASEYLAQLRAESGFADVPPEQMTRAQMQELAARYNGGPYYEDPNAQAYGRAFDKRVDQAKEALQ